MRTRRKVIAVVGTVLLTAAGLFGIEDPAPANTVPASEPSAATVGGIAAGVADVASLGSVPVSPVDPDDGPDPVVQFSTSSEPEPSGQANTDSVPAPAGQANTDSVPAPAGHASPNSDPTQLPIIAAAGNPTGFDGINFASSGCNCQPSDVNAAVSQTQILESASKTFQVTDKVGHLDCSFKLNALLNTKDTVDEARVQFDDVQSRFIFVATVVPASRTAVPAMWLGATTGSDPCGSWRKYRVTFAGSAFPPGTLLDFPILGQDQNAMLFATRNFTSATGRNNTIFSVSKAQVYAGQPINFPVFTTTAECAPATNAGAPMITTLFAYFLCAVPNTGYLVYRMAGSGSPNPNVILQGTVSFHFKAPIRRVIQPGSPMTLDSLDGRIPTSPVNDGRGLWFAHTIDRGGRPSVEFGVISITTLAGTFRTVAAHNTGSDDFNPSLGVGLNAEGGESVLINWVFTTGSEGPLDVSIAFDPAFGIDDEIATFLFGVMPGGVSSQIENRFGMYSSVAMDPSSTTGTCGVIAQQYFGFPPDVPNQPHSDGHWRTFVGRANC
jgi:hypothetical protein